MGHFPSFSIAMVISWDDFTVLLFFVVFSSVFTLPFFWLSMLLRAKTQTQPYAFSKQRRRGGRCRRCRRCGLETHGETLGKWSISIRTYGIILGGFSTSLFVWRRATVNGNCWLKKPTWIYMDDGVMVSNPAPAGLGLGLIIFIHQV